jgi:hypothetical protein
MVPSLMGVSKVCIYVWFVIELLFVTLTVDSYLKVLSSRV